MAAEDLVPADADEYVLCGVPWSVSRPTSPWPAGSWGSPVKSIRGVSDPFQRRPVGDHQVMDDVIEANGVLLALGIVHRGDLEWWRRDR